MIEGVWESVICVIVTVLLLDGIKVFLEALKPYKKREYGSDPSQVSAIICAYNEEGAIGKTLIDLKQILPEKQIIVVDDGSTDLTAKEVKEAGTDIRLIRIDNVGKVGALEEGLKGVKTPLVLILDADVHIGNRTQLPTSLLKENTASAFNVVPQRPREEMSFFANVLFQLQTHEYQKSMQIGKRAEDATASVHCVSDAAGLYLTERLKELTKRHTRIFTGEDLERTLIELVANGKVVFTDQEIGTDVPLTFKELSKQRLVGWWPGLYRNMPLFFKILFRRKTAPILRVEMLYEIFSLATDPFKLITFAFLLLNANWQILLTLYSSYFMLESFIYFRVNGRLFEKGFLVIPIYAGFYSIFQMVLRVCAVFVFLKLMLSTRQSTKV
jgi:biofilm PGA synthesis N-glycosyltransferase PgaC